MDSPRVGPLSPALNLIKNVSKVFLDPSGNPIDASSKPSSANIGQPNSQGPVEQMDARLQKFTSLESLLPIKILGSPVLMRSEWAWKRLIATALEAGSYTSSDTASGFKAKVLFEGWESQISTAPKTSPTKESASSPSAPKTDLRYESAVKLLWTLLASASDSSSGLDSWRIETPRLHEKGPLVEFSNLNQADIKQLSAGVKQWVIKDRLTSSVQFGAYERIGQGMFFPSSAPGLPKSVAYRYQARKQTRITGRGKLVHRIQFEMRVNNQPIRCTLTSMKPTLWVHFDTDDDLLKKHLTIGQEILTLTLKGTGWNLEQWTVSSYEDMGVIE